jgi:DNA polymerase I-like protein with 3'-5' exonuclease and polymerase domains/uracil-DNA glycosylase
MDFESLLKKGITAPAEVAPKPEPETKPEAKLGRVKGFPLRDISLEGIDLGLVPDFCWRGNCENPILIVVTEAPTVIEMNAGVGFISDAARLLDMILDESGINVGDFIANYTGIETSVKRNLPPEEVVASVRATSDNGEVFFYHLNTSPKFDNQNKMLPPTAEESFLYAAIFHNIVLSLTPKHILFLGNGATRMILGRENALSSAGATLDYIFPAILTLARERDGNCDPWVAAHEKNVPGIVVSTDLHPAVMLQNEKELSGWQARLKNMAGSLGSKIEVVPKEAVVLINYEHSYNLLTTWLEEPLDVLCYDWETTDLFPCVHRDSILVSLAISRDTREGFCIPVAHPDAHWTKRQRHKIFGLLRRLFLKPRRATRGHNILFDNLLTRFDPEIDYPVGMRLPGMREETMYMAYVHDENSNRGLKELCNVYTDMHCYDDELEEYKKLNKPKHYGEIPLNILGPYNANDVIATNRLFARLEKELASDGRGPFLDIALRLMSVQGQALEDMAYNGQQISREILFFEGRRHEENLREAMLKLMRAPEMREFIALKREKVALKWAIGRLRMPLNAWRDYAIYVDNNAPDEIRQRIKAWTNDLKFKRAAIDEWGTIRMADGTLHPDNKLIAVLLKAIKDVRFLALDPSNDELEKWKPWLKDEEYQADEDDERYYAANAGAGYKPNFNTHGGGEMGEFFFEHLKFPVNFRSEKTNAPSLSKEARPQLIGLHPILTDFFTYKDTVKEYSVYFKPVIRGFRSHEQGLDSEEIDWRSRSHLEVTIGQVVTGRTNAKRIQTFPRKGKVKNMYVSRYDQGLIIQGDMSQAELRVVACLANERKMIEAYLRGDDLHKTTSVLLFGDAFRNCTDPKLRHEYRAVAKRFNFGIIYGSGAQGLVTTCKKEGAELLLVEGISVEEAYEEVAKELKLSRNDPYAYARIEERVDELRVEIADGILTRFFEAYPDLSRWITGVHTFLTEHGYYYSPFGRIRRLPTVYSWDRGEVAAAKREAQNFPVQSAASDIAVVAIAAMQKEIAERKLSALTFTAVHDAALLDSPLKEAVETAEIVKRRLCTAKENFADLLPEFDTSWLKVPLDSDVSMGPSWGVDYPYTAEGKLLVESKENGDPADVAIEVAEFWDWYLEKRRAA